MTDQEFDNYLATWEDTPFMAGQCIPGPEGGVDCLRFVDAALQAATNQTLEALPRHAQDAALHNSDIYREVVRVMKSRFVCEEISVAGPFQVRDIIIVGYSKRPTHVTVMGLNGKLWHASETGVVWTSVQAIKTIAEIKHAYRPVISPC